MAHQRYFHIRPENIHEESGFIEPEEARHISTVCRVRDGDEILLLDGEGGVYRAVVEGYSRDGATVSIIEKRVDRGGDAPDIAIALIKAGRMDTAVEKCTEIGAGRIIPFACSRTVWRGGEVDALKKRKRMRRKAVAACKQSGRALFPSVERIIDFEELVETVSRYDSVFLADSGGKSLNTLPGRKIIGIVGPEGGLSGDEKGYLMAAGAVPVSLGKNRLRTETAAACMVFYMKIGNRGG